MSFSEATEGLHPDKRQLFPNTLWSVVLQAKGKMQPGLAKLCAMYREPLLTHLRSLGYGHHDASDYVQGFFADLLRRDFLNNVEREKGKFRSFLLCSLKNYLHDQWDRQQALKRGGGVCVKSLDEEDEDGQPVVEPPDHHTGPDIEFDRAWANAVVARALSRTEQECRESGKGELFAALQPMLNAEPDGATYAEIGQRFGMSEGAVKVAAHRLRSRLGALIRDEVRETVSNERELEEELRYLIELFAQ
ncbi:MAG TPA: sigma-70 family RNA polymerase sigma factor [Candidatus Paceibacterota bacterium]|nr:sigma-70 family RNA polymerase sigma factor [Verrucomicrobiota bacterium]HSA09740.1 sigma-70 family RNA polymerase sigma factor [Candidatus Paceibacterota bacterium]